MVAFQGQIIKNSIRGQIYILDQLYMFPVLCYFSARPLQFIREAKCKSMLQSTWWSVHSKEWGTQLEWHMIRCVRGHFEYLFALVTISVCSEMKCKWKVELKYFLGWRSLYCFPDLSSVPDCPFRNVHFSLSPAIFPLAIVLFTHDFYSFTACSLLTALSGNCFSNTKWKPVSMETTNLPCTVCNIYLHGNFLLLWPQKSKPANNSTNK